MLLGHMSIVGLDLGTTNSCCCDAQGRVIRSACGSELTPSYVTIGPKQIVCGEAAQTNGDPSVTFFNFKRTVGKSYMECKPMIKQWPLLKPEHPNRDEPLFGATLNGTYKQYTPSELYVYLIEYMISSVPRPIARVAVTVPAHYNSAQRDATQQAVVQATQCKQVMVLNEPTAAAIAYLHSNNDTATTILVVDVGGGTTDVTLVQQRQVVCSKGTSDVGGVKMTNTLQRYLKQEGLDDTRCEALKKGLSVYDEMSGITRHTYNDLIRGDVELICSLAGEVAEGHHVDVVVLCGGTTRTPLLRERLASMFPRVCTDMCPDTSVARGAALYARQRQQQRLVDVLTQPLSARVRRDHMHTIVPTNTPLPHTCTFRFKPMHAHQRAVALHLFQGSSPLGTWKTQSRKHFTVTIAINHGGQVRVTHDKTVVVDGTVQSVRTFAQSHHGKAPSLG